MNKLTAVAMALLLCLCLAFPALAEESAAPTTEPEPVGETITEPEEEPAPEFTPEPTPETTPESAPESTPEPTADPTPEPTAANEEDLATLALVDEPIAPIYNVTVDWGTLEFTYDAVGTWNPLTLRYENAGEWVPTSNTVTVTSNSNVPVVATMAAELANPYGIDVNIANNPMTLPAAADGSTATGVFTVSLTGTPTAPLDQQTIATLTVTISAPPEP